MNEKITYHVERIGKIWKNRKAEKKRSEDEKFKTGNGGNDNKDQPHDWFSCNKKKREINRNFWKKRNFHFKTENKERKSRKLKCNK